MNDLISRQDAINEIEMICNTPCNQYFVNAIKRLPSAEQQWIPCSERLPKEDGRYLCTYSDFGTCVDFGLYADGQWIVEPIAWMPLPQPWEEVEDEHIDSNGIEYVPYDPPVDGYRNGE